jgi:hypothetical protein
VLRRLYLKWSSTRSMWSLASSWLSVRKYFGIFLFVSRFLCNCCISFAYCGDAKTYDQSFLLSWALHKVGSYGAGFCSAGYWCLGPKGRVPCFIVVGSCCLSDLIGLTVFWTSTSCRFWACTFLVRSITGWASYWSDQIWGLGKSDLTVFRS